MTAKTTPEALPASMRDAPLGDPLTDEEKRLLAEARESLARGERTYSSAEIKALITEMRRKQEGG